MQTSPLIKTSERPLYKQLMQRLKNDITAGVYPAGERIPGEQALCAEVYGVSRVTVRKALEEIVREGLLVRRQGKGTFVAQEKIKRDLGAHHQLFGRLRADRANGAHAPDRAQDGGGDRGRPRETGPLKRCTWCFPSAGCGCPTASR